SCLGDQLLSRVVTTKYGPIQGLIRHHASPSLPAIESFLGVPYASPPTGGGRFTPTSSPLPWDSVRKCTELPPVCPQQLPDVGYPGGSLPPDRMAYLR
ncbi:Carboxylesterase type B, partial [Trinorchestia longiramus]